MALTHFYDKRGKTIQPSDDRYVRVWCGREVRRNLSTLGLTHVQCKNCRAAFARELAALPNADDGPDGNRRA